VLCLLGGAAVAPRLVAIPLRFGERLARTSRGLVLPLAVFEAARRPRAVAAGLLLALAAAAGTFGLAFSSTWDQSQHDQADLRVGTDLTLNLTGPVTAGQSSTLAAATGGTVSPVTTRNVVLGRWIGGTGDVPRLVAVDTRQAGSLLRGRLPDGKTWAGTGALLSPGAPVTGIPLATGPITLTGRATEGSHLLITPRLLLQDKDGLRMPCDAEPVALDGRPHPLHLCNTLVKGAQVIGTDLGISVDPDLPQEQALTTNMAEQSALTVELKLPSSAAPAPAGPQWTALPLGEAPMPIAGARTTPTTTGDTTVLRTEAVVNLQRLSPYDLRSLEIVNTAFASPVLIPAVVSQRLVDELQVPVGGLLTATVGNASVPVTVTGVVPTIPSTPGEVAILVDVDTLSRSLIVRGDFDPPTDSFWVGGPTHPDAGARVAALNLGPVVTRAEVTEQLRSGPLRIGLPAALLVLVPAVILLVLAGTVMHVTSDVDARAVEIARLRGLGLSRRSILGGLLAQHGGLLALLLGCGAVVGVLTSFAVAPLLVRSDFGAAPVPIALASWPWVGETTLLGILLLGSIAAVALVVSIQLRRADAAYLRVGA
jgi:hypothetical protein